MLRFFGVSISVLILTSTCCAQDVIIDWALPSHGLERAPSRLEPPVTLKVVVKNVNDYLYSYRGEITVDPTPESIGPPPGTSASRGQTLSETPDPCQPLVDAQGRLTKGFKADFTLATTGKIPSVPMEKSRAAWDKLKADYRLMETADATGRGCPVWVEYQKDLQAKLQSLNHADHGSHEYTFTSHISANGQTTAKVDEYYDDKPTDGGSREYKFTTQSGRFFLSVGYLVTQAQARSYDAVDIGVIKGTPAIPAAEGRTAVPEVADKTLKELRIQGPGRFRPAGAVLMNYKLPWPKKLLGEEFGVAFSAGPVYRAGAGSASSTVSNVGMFTGLSVHLWERVWITPGFHFAEFSDLPRGFSAGNGLQVPAGYPTSFTGVNRWTTRFGIGITFKASDFKSAAALVTNSAGSAKATDKAPGIAGNPAAAATTESAAGATSAGTTPAPTTELGKLIAAMVKDIATATTAVTNATTARDEANKAQTAAKKTKDTAAAAATAKQKALEEATTASTRSAADVDAARKALATATDAEREQKAQLLSAAEKELQATSENVGLAKGDLKAAEETAKGAQSGLNAATALLSAAIDKLGQAQEILSALQKKRKELCAQLGGCAQ